MILTLCSLVFLLLNLFKHLVIVLSLLKCLLLGSIFQNLFAHISVNIKLAHLLCNILLCLSINFFLFFPQLFLKFLLLCHHLNLLTMRKFTLVTFVTTAILVKNTWIILWIIALWNCWLLQCRTKHCHLLRPLFSLLLLLDYVSIRLLLFSRLLVFKGLINLRLDLFLNRLHILLDLLRLILIPEAKCRVLNHLICLLLYSLLCNILLTFFAHFAERKK